MRAVLIPLLLAACSVATGGPDPIAPSAEAEQGEAEPSAALPVAEPTAGGTSVGDAASASASSGTSADASGVAAEAAPITSNSRADTRAAMGGHDELSELARAAIVSGDLEAFKAAMSAAKRVPLPGDLPAESARYLAELDRAIEARDLATAAARLGAVGEACAACHKGHPAGRFPPSGYPDGDGDVADRMQRHWWGVEAMWQGLVAPSIRSWEVGADALAARDLGVVKGFPDAEAAQGRADAFLGAVRAARGVPDAKRGAAFGRILVECAACHAALGKGPSIAEPAIER